MKKMEIVLIICFLVLGAVGCAKEVPQGNIKENNKQNNVQDVKEETAKVEKTNGLEKTPLFTNKELNSTGEVGGVKYNFKAVQVSKLKFYTQEAAEVFEANKDDELVSIALDVEAENTTDQDISFYISQAKLITNTKEQVESDGLLSEFIDGDFLGKVKKEGTLIYILRNSKAEDITDLELRVDAPTDSNTYDPIGEDIKLNFEVGNK